MSGVTTHILDTSRGRPAAGVTVALEVKKDNVYEEIGRGETDADGRLRTLTQGITLAQGTYRITFHTAAYFDKQGITGFYPEVTIAFEVRAPEEHYHVPLLLNPYGYSTYRGS